MCGKNVWGAESKLHSLPNGRPREDAGGLSREYVLHIPSVS